MLSPYEAEHMIQKIVNSLTPGDASIYGCDTVEAELILEVVNNGLALVKRLNNGTAHAYKLSFENPDSLKLELMNVLAILRFYPNIEQIRDTMVNFMNREFGSCTCRGMDAKKMGLIILNYYYNLNFYPLPPHNVCIRDILQRSLGDLI